MKKYFLFLAVMIAILCLSLLSCRASAKPEVDISSYPPQNEQPTGEDQPELGQPSQEPSQPEDQQQTDHIERNIVVDEHNSAFPIGTPVGQQEQTEVSAQNPLDIWFEYLPAEATLKIDGKEVERDTLHWETKIGYMESVTQFSYSVENRTGSLITYNLHLSPASQGASVPVIVRQLWAPLP